MQRSIRSLFTVLLLCMPAAAIHAQSAAKKTDALPMGPSTLMIHTVPHGSADALAKLFKEVYAGKARIVPLGANKIAVWAAPEVHLEIASQQELASVIIAVIPLDNLDGVTATRSLKAMFDDPMGGPYIEYNAVRNVVWVKGSAKQVQEIKQAVRSLDTPPLQSGSIRTFNLERANAELMAQAIERLYPNLRANPVSIRTITNAVPSPAGASRKTAKEEKDAKAAKTDMPISITAFENRLVVATDDPKAMALVGELVRLLQTPVPQCELQVTQLRSAKAVEVAKILDEAFNGPMPGKGGSSTSDGRGARPRSEIIRVIADPATNSLLIRASALDRIAIDNLLKRLDVDFQGPARTEKRKGGGPPREKR